MAQTRALSPVIIGREKELQELGAHLSQAEQGHGGLVLIAGDAGVGKTRLVREFVRQARQAGAVEVLEGTCSENDAAVPLGPVVQALRGWLRHRGAEAVLTAAGPLKADIARLLPELGPPPKEDLAGDADPSLLSRRLFEAIHRLLQPGPADALRVVILEDLHWSDLTSLELVRFLARVVPEERILLLGTYRQDELHRRHPLTHWLGQLEREDLAETLTLRELARNQVGDMLSATLGRDVPGAFTDALHGRTGGNPFFLEEILKSVLVAHGVDRLLEAGAGVVLDRVVMPLSVKDSVLARISDLDDTTSRVLTYAAVIGREFDFVLLRELTEISESELVQAISVLVDRQLVGEDASDGEDRFVFRHALTREVIYQDLLGREKRNLHVQVLSAMEGLGRDQDEGSVEALAYHSYQGKELEKAARYGMLAGERAERMHAYREARQHYELVLELTETGGSRPRADLLDRLGTVALRVGDAQIALRYWTEARTLFVELGETFRVSETERKLSLAAWGSGDTKAGLAHARAAVEILEDAPPSVELGLAYSTLSQRLMLAGESEDAIAWGRKALDMVERLGDQHTRVHALNNIGSALGNLGRPEEGIPLLEESLRLAEGAGLTDDIQRACINLAGLLSGTGEERRSIVILQRGLEIAQAAGDMTSVAHISGNLAWAHFARAEWGLTEDQLEVSRRAAPDYIPASLSGILLSGMIGMDRGGEVQGFLDELIRTQPLFQEHKELLLPFYVRLGRCLQRLGQASQAIEALDLAHQTWANQGLDIGSIGWMGTALEVCLDLGEEARAEKWLASIAKAPQATSLGWTRSVWRGCLGLMAKYRGEFGQAVESLTASIAEWSRLEYAYVEADDRRSRAACLLQLSDETSVGLARSDLAWAREVFERTGSVYQLGILSKLEDLLPGGAPSQAATKGPLASLTPREREVLVLLARGLSNREIAKELVISAKTAEIHVGNILGKLDLKSRAQAAALAVEQGMAKKAVDTSDSS